MSDFGYGLAKGFFGTLADQSIKRQETAEEYFQKQVDLARTRGLQNKGRVRQAIDESVSVAKQLNQMGVPKNVIMSVANQNPKELATLYDTVVAAQQAGTPINEAFFNDVMEISGDFKAPDEDFNSFFRRVYEPVAANYKADPEGFQRDQKGSLIRTFLGYNAMDSARERLGKTVIADGMTAEQLLAYGDEVVPNRPLGDTTVTYRHDRLKDKTSSGKGLGGADIDRINSAADEERRKFILEQDAPEGQLPSEDVIKREVAKRLYVRYADVPGYAQGVERITGYSFDDIFGGDSEQPGITEEVLPPSIDELNQAGIGNEPVPENVPAPPKPAEVATGNPAPVDPDAEPEMRVVVLPDKKIYFQKNNGDGTAVYEDDTGQVYTLKLGNLRKYVQQQLGAK